MLSNLITHLRPLVHPMLVHFPIALLFAGVALDWVGYWLRRPSATRFGFYLQALGAMSAVAAAIVGPDEGSDTLAAAYGWHTLFALTTVALALALVAVRFVTLHGLQARAALVYLGGTLALLASVSLTGYFGGELVYNSRNDGSASTVADAAPTGAAALVAPHLHAKPLIALLCLLCMAALSLWLHAVRRASAERGPLWTLQRAESRSAPSIAREDTDADRYARAGMGS